MTVFRIKGKLVLASMVVGFTSPELFAQVADRGLSPPSNTLSSFQNASIARDSGLNQPLDLLNDFYPAIAVIVSDHQNVRRRPDFDEEDLKVTINPSLAYRTNVGRHQFYAAYNGTITYHDEITQEDSSSNRVDANLGLDLSRRWDVTVFGGFGDGVEERGISGGLEFDRFANNGIANGPEKIDYLNYGADLIFGRKTGIVTAVLGYEYGESDFRSSDLLNQEDSRTRDRSTESVHFDLNWQFASKTSAFVRVQRTETNFSAQTVNIDNDQTDFLVGVRVKATNKLNGVLSVGRSDRDFDDPSREGYDDNAYYVNVNYSITPFSVLSFNASRLVEEPSAIDSSFYESELFGLAWNHALTPKLSLELYGKLIDDDYDIERQDEFTDWGVGLDYSWRRWLSTGVFYGEIERESTLSELDYEDKYFGIRLQSDLRSLLRGRGRNDTTIEPSSFGLPKKTQRTR